MKMPESGSHHKINVRNLISRFEVATNHQPPLYNIKNKPRPKSTGDIFAPQIVITYRPESTVFESLDDIEKELIRLETHIEYYVKYDKGTHVTLQQKIVDALISVVSITVKEANPFKRKALVDYAQKLFQLLNDKLPGKLLIEDDSSEPEPEEDIKVFSYVDYATYKKQNQNPTYKLKSASAPVLRDFSTTVESTPREIITQNSFSSVETDPQGKVSKLRNLFEQKSLDSNISNGVRPLVIPLRKRYSFVINDVEEEQNTVEDSDSDSTSDSSVSSEDESMETVTEFNDDGDVYSSVNDEAGTEE